ncbi:hypothetical protein [Microbacterium sp. H1-D42]|uniref:HIT family protein n=1 Tax=Microbacterium sp. H1-D42 TaxID=2925844 RepID=UPI001F53085C|nr:hypothetical protein [Microbacterium sp. H1-D42]UNK70308.1 hypothetical protein MNR00_14235 [Microbacterium sp. H1-D42]
MTDQSLTHSSLPDATCVFCELVAGRIPCDKVAEDATTLAFMDTDPGSDGWQAVFHFHLHVIPRYRDRSKDRMELPFEPGMPSDADARAQYARLLSAAL